MTITANNQNTSYGASSDTSLNAGYTHTALVSGDSIANVVLSTADGINSAGYFNATTGSSITPASATGTGLSNYAITYDTGTLTVAQATLTITANNQSTSYGASGDTSLNAGYIHSALVSGDSIANVVLSTADGTNSAGYFNATTGSSITPANATGTGLANYAITYDAGSLTVAQATLTITANNQSTSYGAASDNSLNAGYTHTALVAGDSIASVTLSTTDSAKNNGYFDATTGSSISPSNATGPGISNYAITYDAGTLTVNPYAFAYQIGNASQIYGTATNLASDLGTTIPTGVNSQTLDIAYSSTGDTASANVQTGGYAITGTLSNGTGLAADYAVTLENGTLTVTPATLTVTANNATKGYDQPNPPFTDGITGFVNNDNSSVVSGSASLSTTATTTSSAGSYPITVTAGSLSAVNYTFSFVNGTLSITQDTPTIAVSSSSNINTSTYGNQVTFTATLAGSGFSVAEAAGESVTFMDGSINLGTGTLSSGGVANLHHRQYAACRGNQHDHGGVWR